MIVLYVLFYSDWLLEMGYKMTEADRNMIHELYPSLFIKYAPPLSVEEIESCIFDCKYSLSVIIPSLEQKVTVMILLYN